jgi:hypothetical protein
MKTTIETEVARRVEIQKEYLWETCEVVVVSEKSFWTIACKRGELMCRKFNLSNELMSFRVDAEDVYDIEAADCDVDEIVLPLNIIIKARDHYIRNSLQNLVQKTS